MMNFQVTHPHTYCMDWLGRSIPVLTVNCCASSSTRLAGCVMFVTCSPAPKERQAAKGEESPTVLIALLDQKEVCHLSNKVLAAEARQRRQVRKVEGWRQNRSRAER